MPLAIRILRWKPIEVVSRKLAAAAVYGTPLGASSSDALSFDLGDSTHAAKNFLGVLTRDVVAGGPTFVERAMGIRNAPNADGSAGLAGLELPDSTGGYVTARIPEDLEADGSTFLLTSGTGAITSVAAGIIPGQTEAALIAGKWRIKQAGDAAVGLFTAVGLDDSSGGTSAVRIRIY